MTGLCGLTGCRSVAVLKCYKCSLPLCPEHAVAFETKDGGRVCCHRCAAYLKAKSVDGEPKETGGGHAD